MSMQRLVGLRLLPESKSYIDALHGVLSHSGLYAAPKYMLAGMTVTAFRFSVDRLITAESPTAYNWIAENFLAADFIGVSSSQQAGFSFDPTFPLYQKEALHAIKHSINRGIGVIIWKDQFVIVTGYDDSRQVLFYSDGMEAAEVADRSQMQEQAPHAQADEREDEYGHEHVVPYDYGHVLPYEQFGRNVSPYWYFQILEERVELDEREIYRESFMQAIYKWETHDLMLPEGEYACGKNAYSAIIHALETGRYDKTGIWSVIDTYAAAKRDLAHYTRRLEQIWPQSKAVAACYAELNRIYEQIVTTAAYVCHERNTAELKQASDFIHLFRQALAVEDEAIQCIKRLMRETVDNRFNDIALR